MNEQLRTIPGFPAYSITDDGRIWSTHGRGRWLKPATTKDGYQRVSLFRDRKSHSKTIHTLVALAWIGPRPEGLNVCHGDGDPANNSVDNLRYDTQAGNLQDMIRHGTSHNAAKTHCPAGHPYDEENTRRSKRGRDCRTCLSARTEARRKWRRVPDPFAFLLSGDA